MFDFCDLDLPLHLVGLKREVKTLKTNDGCVQFGASKYKLRCDLFLSLSMSGLILNATLPWRIKVEDGKVNYFTKTKKKSNPFAKRNRKSNPFR